jgi:hypothetical protein
MVAPNAMAAAGVAVDENRFRLHDYWHLKA